MRLTAALSLALALTSCTALDGDKAYRIPSSSMEPTLHCARPAHGCEADEKDTIVTEAVEAEDLRRGDIVVYETPPAAETYCGVGGTFVARLIGLPGEHVEMLIEEGLSYVYIDGRKLDEPYVEAGRRDAQYDNAFELGDGEYVVMGDNRSQSCDSREWGPVPAENIHHRAIRIERSSDTIDLR